MKEEIIEIIANVLEIPKDGINEKTNLIRDLDVESLELVDLITCFEEKYQIEILDKDIKTLQTVDDIIKYIESKKSND